MVAVPLSLITLPAEAERHRMIKLQKRKKGKKEEEDDGEPFPGIAFHFDPAVPHFDTPATAGHSGDVQARSRRKRFIRFANPHHRK